MRASLRRLSALGGRSTIRAMGLFRPARRVTGPRGESWELYVSKTALPAWREPSAADYDVDPRAGLVVGVVDAVWGSLVYPLLRFVAALPFAVVRGRRTRAVRIEAVSWYPEKEVHLWTTTDVQARGVLDEIAGGLAAGRFVEPLGSVYAGLERD
jgi:hypothetical protein